MGKKIVAVAILVLAVISAPGATYASEAASGDSYIASGVSPMWTGMSSYESDLTISSGKAVCTVLVSTTSAKADKVSFSIKLQQYQSGSWKTIDSWDQSVAPSNGSANFKESASISKGFTYRFTGTIKTYKNGALLDTCSITSMERTY
jgi:hypothetical protein